MSKETKEDPTEVPLTPLEVTIKNKDKKDTTYDSQDAEEYDTHTVTEEEIKEAEDGHTSG